MAEIASAGKDGSIILTTKVDTSGINKDLNALKNSISKIGAALGAAFSINALLNFSKAASEMATQAEASAQRIIDIYGEASGAVNDFIDANARALGMSKAAASSYASVYGNLFSVWADQATNANLTNHYLNMTAVVASKTGRTVEDVQERIRSGLLGNTEAIEDLGIFVNIKTIEMTDAFQRMASGQSWEQLDGYTQQQIRTMAILEQATAKYGIQVADTSALAKSRFAAAYQDFAATWGQLINKVLMPVLNVLAFIFDAASKGLRSLFGLTTETSSVVGEIAGGTGNITKGIKNINKELKKTLAGFDEIQKLESDSGGGVADSGGAVGGGGAGIDLGAAPEVGADMSGKAAEIVGVIATVAEAAATAMLAVGLIILFSGNIPLGLGLIAIGFAGSQLAEGNNPAETVVTALTELKDVIAPFLLVVGVVAMFLGAVVIGIGLLLAGAVAFGIQELELQAYDSASLTEQLNIIMEAVAVAAVAIGVMLIFLGMMPLGVGFVIFGLETLGIAEAKLEEGGITTKVSQFIDENGKLIVGVAVALIVIGIFLMLSGAGFGLGIGLFLAGGAILAHSEAEDQTYVANKIQAFIDENGKLMVGVSIALLVIGIILMLSGVGFGLGLGLLVTGGVILASAPQQDVSAVGKQIDQFFKDNKALIDGVAWALLVLGVILVFTGAGIGLGLGLILAAVVQLFAPEDFSFSGLLDSLKGVWEDIVGWWNQYVAPIFTAEWWENLGKDALNGLIGGVEAGVNAIIGLFESMINWVVDGLNKISFEVPDWVPGIGGSKFGFNIPRANFGRLSIPRLAEGAVIPPSNEFLAVLGDQKRGYNIEAPLQTIVDAFNMALDGRGQSEAVMEVDGEVFGRIIYRLNKKQSRRVGVSFSEV